MLPASQKFSVGEKVKTALNFNKYEIESFEGSEVNLKTIKQFIVDKEVPVSSPTFKTHIDNLIKMETLEVINTVLPNEKVEIQNATLQDNAYIPSSNTCRILDTVSPASMKYEQRKAIETIDRRVNGVDEFVALRLGYCIDGCTAEAYKEGMSKLCDAFAAEQVDAIAVAIYNIEKGMGCIIGDMTGIGKGRQAAAIIRYAVKYLGKKPIFLTKNPGLFSDMFRDMVDINFDPAVPLERLVGQREVERKLVKDTTEDEAAIEGIEMDDEEAITTEMILVPDYQKNKYYEADIKKALIETGVKQLVPFIVNGRSKYTSVRDKEGNILYKGLSQADTAKIILTGQLPAEYDFVISTYSQFRQKIESNKMRFLRSIAQDNIIIMDESHEASGSSNTGVYLRGVLGGTKGVTFLSATFAKTPANMPIYANKTSMREANLSSEKLIEAIQAGGVALQEIISSQLVAEGQMIRRERSFEGVEVNYMYLNSSQDESGKPQYNREVEHRAIMDKATEIVRDIIAFQEDFVNPIIEAMDKIAAAEMSEVEKRKGTKEAGVGNSPVFSGIFQLINQLLFSIKADTVAEMAISRIKQGLKPVIAFASTMESFLDSMTDDEGKAVQVNDKINTDFSLVLRRRLDGVLRFTVTSDAGVKEYDKIKIEEQNIEFKVEYNRILEKIKAASIGIVSSPIDYIIQKIEKAGYSVGEVTGRKRFIQLGENGLGTIKTRQKESNADLFRKFNNNETDCLMINVSGAVGASAHAVPTPKVPNSEVKQRVMIVLQAELDISMEVQKRGRINRTGQIFKPIYDYAISAIPAEMRLMMMLQRKLKSLDANVTSNQKESRKVLDIQDFLNKYGDQICVEYLMENRDINKIIGDPLKLESSKSSGAGEKEKDIDTTNAAQRVTGRIAILATKLQEDFYQEVSERYVSLVDYMKQTGEYDLEVESVNLEAQKLSSEVVVAGLGGTSPFGRNSILEKCEVNVLKKPFTKDELEAIIKESLTIEDAQSGEMVYDAEEMKDKIVKTYLQWAERKILEEEQELNEKYSKLIADIKKEKGFQKLSHKSEEAEYIETRTKALKQASADSIDKVNTSYGNKGQAITANFKSFLIGNAYAYPSRTYQADQSYHKGIFVGFEINDRVKNPYAPSAIKLRFAFPNSMKYLAVPMSKFDIIAIAKELSRDIISYNEGEYMIDEWNELRKKSAGDRQTRYIVTGNILQAFGKEEFRGGKLISYTVKDGGVKKGILLSEDFSVEASSSKKALRVTIPATKAIKFIQRLSDGGSYETSDMQVSLQKRRGDYAFFIPLAKKKNEQYITNNSLIELTKEGRFEQSTYSRDKMVATFEPKNLKAFLEVLQNSFGLSFEISASVVASQEEIDLGETEYNDEEKFESPKEIIIEKLTEEDRGFDETLSQQAFEAEEKLRAEETLLEADKETQALTFDKDRRKLNVTKKLMHLVSLLVNEKVAIMRSGGAVKAGSMEKGGVVIYKELDLNRRDGKTKTTQVTTVDSYREALERIEELKKNNNNPNIKYFTGDIYRASGGSMATGGGVGEKKKYEVTLEDIFSFATLKKEVEITDAQYEQVLRDMKSKKIVFDKYNAMQGIHEQLRVKSITSKFAEGGGVRAQKQYNKEVDAYKWFVVNPETKRVESGFEFREDAMDLKKDMQYPEQWVVLSAKGLKLKGVDNPVERWKKMCDGGVIEPIAQ